MWTRKIRSKLAAGKLGIVGQAEPHRDIVQPLAFDPYPQPFARLGDDVLRQDEAVGADPRASRTV